jgi:predicted esterase
MNTIEITTQFPVSYSETGPKESKNIVVLLHGYAQSGEEIMNLLSSSIPSDYRIIAPNGPYPFYKVNKKTKSPEFKYSWYVFDPIKNQYLIDYKYTVNSLHSFFKEMNILDKKLIIVGYSQGGYLSLLLAESVKEIKRSIGLGCRYRTDLLKKPPTHTYFTSIHGELDTIVDYQQAKEAFNDLLELGIKGTFISLNDTAHRINENFKKTLTQVFQEL